MGRRVARPADQSDVFSGSWPPSYFPAPSPVATRSRAKKTTYSARSKLSGTGATDLERLDELKATRDEISLLRSWLDEAWGLRSKHEYDQVREVLDRAFKQADLIRAKITVSKLARASPKARRDPDGHFARRSPGPARRFRRRAREEKDARRERPVTGRGLRVSSRHAWLALACAARGRLRHAAQAARARGRTRRCARQTNVLRSPSGRPIW